ncbi:MAG TPA: CPBP family intramembrane glutamic endopeptidase [Planctomycetia bacterium]|nr:CPBP family intramembrane glutamic endopeptidase [Planctomycetia bacterium]
MSGESEEREAAPEPRSGAELDVKSAAAFEEKESLLPSSPPSAHYWLIGAGVELALVPLAALFGWLAGVLPWSRLHITPAAFAWGVAATLPLLVLLAALMRIRISALEETLRFIREAVLELTGPRPAQFKLAALALAAGVGEEFLFRGFLQDWLAAKSTFPLALLGASFAFGLLHPFAWWYVLLAGAIGAYLGALYQFTGSLLPPILAHFLYDWVALHAILRTEPRPPVGGEAANHEATAPVEL